MADPNDLRTMRLRKGIDLVTVADKLGIRPETLRAIEAGELRGSDAFLAACEDVIVTARAPRPWWLVRRVIR